jgi:DNA polymerase III subunit epsilon
VSGGAVPSPDGLEVLRGGVLIERVATLLGAGPLTTEELARQVLGMRGSPRAAAAAVWTLLGSDPRFEVSGGGVWSLRGTPPPAAPRPLRDEEWVVVDVETTGGTPSSGHRITEVAAVRVSGGQIREVYASLVNPCRPIPRMITRLTGITDAMVRGAPRFREIAPRLSDALQGRVFVAHNAPFDWRFVCAEMEMGVGGTLSGRRLCTVRLARKLLPHLPSRSLDALADYFGLGIAARHRAEDDAVATAHVLLRFVEILADRGIEDWAGVETLLGQRTPRRRPRRGPHSMDAA